jgi:hypothetical protein
MGNLEDLVRKSFKILVEGLPKVSIFAVSYTIAYEHTGNVSVDDLFFKVLLVLRVEEFAPVFLVHLVLEI